MKRECHAYQTNESTLGENFKLSFKERKKRHEKHYVTLGQNSM